MGELSQHAAFAGEEAEGIATGEGRIHEFDGDLFFRGAFTVGLIDLSHTAAGNEAFDDVAPEAGAGG